MCNKVKIGLRLCLSFYKTCEERGLDPNTTTIHDLICLELGVNPKLTTAEEVDQLIEEQGLSFMKVVHKKEEK